MRKSRILVSVLLVVAIGLFWSIQAGAYYLFSGENNCDQCHTDFPGDTHTFHIDAGISCASCHEVEPIPSSACSACHLVDDLLVLHAPLEDQMGYQCSDCHESTGAESRSLTDLKKLFE